MSWRKKIGWRGPLRLPVSDAVSSGAQVESALEGACCAVEPGLPSVRRAARPPAATPPTTNASLRIIISPVRKYPGLALGQRAPKYSPHSSLYNPTQGNFSD